MLRAMVCLLVVWLGASTHALAASEPAPALVASATAPLPPLPDRRIAITFDDLPWVISRDDAPADLPLEHRRLLNAIKQTGVPAIGFVNEGKLFDGNTLRPERVRMLGDWLDAGYELGNHTRWHSDLHAVGVKAYEADVLQGELKLRPMLAKRGLKPRWFRHPFLRTGRTLEEEAAVDKFLARHGYRVAPVTVNSSEWIFALAYRKTLAAGGGEETLARLRTEYIDYMLAVLAHYEQRSVDLLGYELPQVLLLHANEINAATFPDLVARIRARGYRFVTLDEATADPAYRHPDAYTGALGTSWINRWAKTENRAATFFGGGPRTAQWVMTLAGVGAGAE